MKSIELTQSQIKALQSGATMFLFTIDNENISIDSRNPDVFLSAYKFECSYCKGKDSQCTDCYGKGYIWDLDCESKEEFIAKYSPIQKGDKDIFVQEEFWQYENDILYKSNSDSDEEMLLNGDYEPTSSFIWSSASQMTKEQSRYSFNECIDAKAIRVKDITIESKIKIIGHINTNMELNKDSYNENLIYHYNQQMKEQNINRTYEDNDYVFLIEFA